MFDIVRGGVVFLLTFIALIALLPPEGKEKETLVASAEKQSQLDTEGLVRFQWAVCVCCGLGVEVMRGT